MSSESLNWREPAEVETGGDSDWLAINIGPKFDIVISKSKQNIEEIKKLFTVEIKVDYTAKKIYVKGEARNKSKAKTYFSVFVKWMQKREVMESLVIFPGRSLVTLLRRYSCRKCKNGFCEIKEIENPESTSMVLKSLPDIRESMKNDLLKLKREESYSVLIHYGYIHYEKDPGAYSVQDLQTPYEMSFSKIPHHKFQFELLKKLTLVDSFYRIDLEMFTPDETMLRYEIFMNAEGKPISKPPHRFYHQLGPGCFCDETQIVSTYDFIDPKSSIVTRFRFKSYQGNQTKANKDHNALRTTMENLKIQKEPEEFTKQLRCELPEGYMLTYFRKSFWQSYRYGSHTKVNMSKEQRTVSGCLNRPRKSVAVSLTCDKLNDDNWEVDDILVGFDEAFACLDELI